MSVHAAHPTPYPDVNALLHELLSSAQTILGDGFNGVVVSKPVAGRWAQDGLGERWAALIAQALAWRHDAPSDNLNETLNFVRYTLERSQRFEALVGEAGC